MLTHSQFWIQVDHCVVKLIVVVIGHFFQIDHFVQLFRIAEEETGVEKSEKVYCVVTAEAG